MTPEQFRRVEELFFKAKQLPPSEQAEFLRSACADDAEVRTEVERMLKEPDATMTLTAGAERHDDGNAAGGVIGRYRIIREIGAGGMGVVYEAQQDRTHQLVALKVINPGLASAAALRRFEHEAEVLGRLQHVGIARIFDADTFDAGSGPQPFFAMELVDGRPLTAYADEHKLGTRERLELIAKVADAVHHAHQRGIIHRDLKPGNILVTADGQPKILDFGVARATDGDIQATTLRTDIGQLIGTIPYMSPEQAAGDPNELDTRSDVYALGVVAYELLAGRLPYDVQRKLIHEAIRIIREEEPTRLSSGTMWDGRPARQLRGDVETIIGKALEKDKTRRYQSASDLATDIGRYLNDEPIAARPASTAYQFRKFASRHKAIVAGVAAVFAVLVAATTVSLWFGLREAAARARESQALARESEQRGLAEKRAEETQQVANFQAKMLSQIDPTDAGVRLMQDIRARFEAALAKSGASEAERVEQSASFATELSRVNATDTTADLIDRTILKPAIAAIEKEFASQPVVDAALRQTLADLYQSIGKHDAALLLQEEALATRRRVLGEEHPDTLTSIGNMGTLLMAQGKHEQAEPFVREALATRRRVLGEEHPDTLTSIDNMGALLMVQGKHEQAEPFVREALATRRRVLSEEHTDTLVSLNNMGRLLQAQGKLDQAEPYLREALEKFRRVLGEENPDTLTSMINMGILLHDHGKLDQAEPYFREVLEKSRRVLGEEHPKTLTCMSCMGSLLQHQGKLDQAEPYFREVLEKSRRVKGEEHPETLASMNNMGSLLREQGKLAEAEPYFREALEKRRRVLGEEHPDTLGSMNNLGELLLAQGKLDQAVPYLREVLEKFRRVLGEEHPNTLISIGIMGQLLLAQGKLDQAEPYYREALEKQRRVLGEEHPDTLRSISGMGFLLQSQGKFAEAEPYWRETLKSQRQTLGDDHPDTMGSISNIGFLLLRQGKLAEAEPYCREALEKSRRVLGEEHPDTLTFINNMGAMLKAQGKLDQAEPYYREALEKLRRVLGEEHPNTLTSISNLGVLLQAEGKLDQAERYSREALERRRRLLGDEHPETLSSFNNMGLLLQAQGKLEEAEPYYREALEKCRRVLGDEHPQTLTSINNMGFLLQAQGKPAEAEPYYREALEKHRRVLGDDHPDTLISIRNLGRLQRELGNLKEADALAAEAVAGARAKLAPMHPFRLAAIGALGTTKAMLGRYEEAESLLIESYEGFSTSLGPTHERTIGAMKQLADLYAAWHAAEPGKGYDVKAAEWQAKLAEWQASTQPAAADPELQKALHDWSVVFEDPLTGTACLERAELSRGPYTFAAMGGDAFTVRIGDSLRTYSPWGDSVAWWRQPVGDTFVVSAEFRREDYYGKASVSEVGVWLCGPGYGHSACAGYVLRSNYNGGQFELRKSGELVQSRVLGQYLLVANRWYRVDLLRAAGEITVFIDGQSAAVWSDDQPLNGALHQFVGVGGRHPVGWRMLAIRVPAAEATRLAGASAKRLYDPPGGEPEWPDGEPLVAYDFASAGLQDWDVCRNPDAVKPSANGLVLSGINSTPRLWNKVSLHGDVAVEVEFEYLADSGLAGFLVSLSCGSVLDGEHELFQGWGVYFPQLRSGDAELRWHTGREPVQEVGVVAIAGGLTQLLGATPFYVPAGGRRYTVRLEKTGTQLRVFSNHGLLLTGTAPNELGTDTPVYVGLGTFYGGVQVHSVKVWQLRDTSAVSTQPADADRSSRPATTQPAGVPLAGIYGCTGDAAGYSQSAHRGRQGHAAAYYGCRRWSLRTIGLPGSAQCRRAALRTFRAAGRAVRRTGKRDRFVFDIVRGLGHCEAMPRTARQVPGGMVFHVLNRGVGRMRLFEMPDGVSVRGAQSASGRTGAAGGGLALVESLASGTGRRGGTIAAGRLAGRWPPGLGTAREPGGNSRGTGCVAAVRNPRPALRRAGVDGADDPLAGAGEYVSPAGTPAQSKG